MEAITQLERDGDEGYGDNPEDWDAYVRLVLPLPLPPLSA